MTTAPGVAEPEFVAYVLASFQAWEQTTDATGDHDSALVQHTLDLLGDGSGAGAVLEDIDRRRAAA